jgi:hypothetical protein
MAIYYLRVILHSKPNSHPDYTKLHDELDKKGFKRKIQDDKSGEWYHLPHAEYVRTSVLTLDEVHNQARKIADVIDTDNAVLIAKSSTVMWTGLDPV